MNSSLYNLVWVFVIYSFLGWCLEVVYAKYKHQKWVNRGFLNGPYCPIYGASISAIVYLLGPFEGNILAIYLGSVFLTTAFELTTGYVLEKVFNQKWWDYSDDNWNFKGYVCLWNSIIWGFACLAVIYLVQPQIDRLLDWVPVILGGSVLLAVCVFMTIDLCFTVFALLKLRRRVYRLNDLFAKINSISEGIVDGAVAARKTSEKRLGEMDQLIRKYQEILNEKVMGYKRITDAFPNLRAIRHKIPRIKK